MGGQLAGGFSGSGVQLERRGSRGRGNEPLTTTLASSPEAGTIPSGARCSDTSLPKARPEGFSMYDVKPDRLGWTVYDAETGRPAELDGFTLVGLEHEAADETASLLNRSVYGRSQKRLSSWPLMPPASRRAAGRPLARR